MARVVAVYIARRFLESPLTWDLPAKRSNPTRARLEPPRVGGEVDGEPALRALAADRLGDRATDRVDGGDVAELHAGRNGKVDLDELGTSDLGDIARVGLEAVAGDDGIHDAPHLGGAPAWGG